MPTVPQITHVSPKDPTDRVLVRKQCRLTSRLCPPRPGLQPHVRESRDHPSHLSR